MICYINIASYYIIRIINRTERASRDRLVADKWSQH